MAPCFRESSTHQRSDLSAAFRVPLRNQFNSLRHIRRSCVLQTLVYRLQHVPPSKQAKFGMMCKVSFSARKYRLENSCLFHLPRHLRMLPYIMLDRVTACLWRRPTLADDDLPHSGLCLASVCPGTVRASRTEVQKAWEWHSASFKAYTCPCSAGTDRYRERYVACTTRRGSARDRDRSRRGARSRTYACVSMMLFGIFKHAFTYRLTSVYQ